MPEYTIVRTDNGQVICRTTDLAELPDKRDIAGMRMLISAVLCEDGVEVTGDRYGELIFAIQDARDEAYAKRHP